MAEDSFKNYLECCIINQCGEPGCDNYDARRDLLQKIIDGQANEEEKMLYESIVAQCTNCKCKQYCEQEVAIKNLLQTKLDRKRVPIDVVEKIKTSIIKTS